jgi:dihydrofolate reductase
MLSIIAAIGKNRELGKDNDLLWHIPGDLPRFKKLTSGHPVILGRKTFQSIGRPLPNRTNIVITRDPSFAQEGIIVVSSFEEALEKAKTAPGAQEVFVIGGGSIYAQAIDQVDRLYLTVVDATAEADTFFPDYSQFNKILSSEQKEAEGLRFTYLTLEKSI